MTTTSHLRVSDPERRASTSSAASPSQANISTPSAADQHLRAQVLERLSQTALRRLGIQIHVQGGLVRVCGHLRDPRLRAHAEWLVFTTEGVQAVCSDWTVRSGHHHGPAH